MERHSECSIEWGVPNSGVHSLDSLVHATNRTYYRSHKQTINFKLWCRLIITYFTFMTVRCVKYHIHKPNDQCYRYNYGQHHSNNYIFRRFAHPFREILAWHILVLPSWSLPYLYTVMCQVFFYITLRQHKTSIVGFFGLLFEWIYATGYSIYLKLINNISWKITLVSASQHYGNNMNYTRQ